MSGGRGGWGCGDAGKGQPDAGTRPGPVMADCCGVFVRISMRSEGIRKSGNAG